MKFHPWREMHPKSLLYLLLGLHHVVSRAFAQDGGFLNCSIENYYQGFNVENLESWDKMVLSLLLRGTHRQVLPYTSSTRDDVWDALIDLDSAGPGLVRLLYQNKNASSLIYGTTDTWNREHLWPKSLGVGDNGPDFTDIHALRPADSNVNSARGNLFFGDCEKSCTSRPAAPETAMDTAKNSIVFLPPDNVRGDIARSLLYMELRYSFPDEENTQVLQLTDCPDDFEQEQSNGNDQYHQMAFLSELLKWHEDDPPDDYERERNDKACTKWQGNRNIFVDFPLLAFAWHGKPASKPYFCNNSSTTSPTVESSLPDNNSSEPPSDSPSSFPVEESNSGLYCSDLNRGDVQIVAINSDNPDSVSLVTLERLAPGLELYMTDNAWSGLDFQTNEGTIKMQIPMEGIEQGTVFGYGDPALPYSDLWESVGTSAFALATAGDSVIVYCYDGNGTVVHLGALISGQWETTGNEETQLLTSHQSYLPESLSQVGSVEIPAGWNNLVYNGSTIGTRVDILEALRDTIKWRGSNTERLIYSGSDFIVLEDNGGDSNFSEKYLLYASFSDHRTLWWCLLASVFVVSLNMYGCL